MRQMSRTHRLPGHFTVTKVLRTVLPLLMALFLLLATVANAQTETVQLENLPLSSSMLMARAIQQGRVLVGGQPLIRLEVPDVSCSPAPCVLPNVNIFPSTAPQNETPVVVNLKNHRQLLAGANDSNCANLQGFYNSSDGGTTWSHFCMANIASIGLGAGDPAVGYDLKGSAYIAGIDFNGTNLAEVVFQKSKDNGKTWSAPALAVPNVLGGLTDKEWLQIDTNPKSPHKNTVYISVTQFDSIVDNTQISVSHSTDGGATWKTVLVDAQQKFPHVDQFSDIAIGADGKVYVTWMRCTKVTGGNCADTKATFLLSISKDGGNTWSKATKIATATLAPDPNHCCFYGALPVTTHERVSNIPVVGIDNSNGPHKGNLYVAFYNWTGNQMRVMVATSSNGGKTWKIKAVGDSKAKNDEFFQWLNVNSKGVVGVTWDDRRHDATNTSYESFAAFSNNGGVSFGKNIDLSAAPSNPNNDGFGGTFLGDYTGNYWADDTLYNTYTDTSKGVDQIFLAGYIL